MALVNFEAVAAAAEALQVAGQRPSVRAVIAHLGGGSPNAVLKHLGEWKAGRPVVRIEDTALDARITSAITDQMQRVAVAASAAAEERAAGIEDDLQALAEAQQSAEQQIEALTAERDAARQQADELARQLADAQADAERSAQHATEQAAALRAELAGERDHQERTAAELARAEMRLEGLPDLHAEIERQRAALADSEQARHQAEQQAAVLAAKLEAVTDRATRAEARTEQTEKQAQTTARELASANLAVQAGQARLESAARELDDAKKAASEARATAKTAGEEAAELRGKLGVPAAPAPGKRTKGAAA